MLSFPPIFFFSFTLHLLLCFSSWTLLPALLPQLHIISSRKRALLMILLLFFVAFFGCFTYIYAYITSSLFLSSSSSSLSSSSPSSWKIYTQKTTSIFFGSIKNETCLSQLLCEVREREKNPLLRLYVLRRSKDDHHHDSNAQ